MSKNDGRGPVGGVGYDGKGFTHPQESRLAVMFDQLYRWNLVDGQWKLSKVDEQELMELKAAVAAMDAGVLSEQYPELVRQAMGMIPADAQ